MALRFSGEMMRWHLAPMFALLALSSALAETKRPDDSSRKPAAFWYVGIEAPPKGSVFELDKAIFIDKSKQTVIDADTIRTEFFAVVKSKPPASVFSGTSTGEISCHCKDRTVRVWPVRSFDKDGKPVWFLPPLDDGPSFTPVAEGSWQATALALMCSLDPAASRATKVPMNMSLAEFAASRNGAKR